MPGRGDEALLRADVPGIHVLTELKERGLPGRAHGCPVRFLWTRRMALILLCSKRLATFWDTEKDQALLHHNSVFHGLLKHVPWDRFDRLVEEHGADARVRRLSTKGQFIALLYGQLSGSTSLREIVTGLGSHSARLYHLGRIRFGGRPCRMRTHNGPSQCSVSCWP